MQPLQSAHTVPTTDPLRWAAVLARDPACDGHWVFAVRTTGIYCRPSCPARHPRPDNVTFFATPAAAGAAGYRPCLRCRPDEAASSGDASLVGRVCALLESHADRSLSLSELASEVGYSPSRLQRAFKRVMGMTPHAWSVARRLERFKQQARRRASVTEALYDAGFGSSRGLYENAPGLLGMTPATYQQGGKNMHIAYAIVPSSLGRLLVAATSRGVCAVSLGDDDAALQQSLRDEYPAATLVSDLPELRQWIAEVVAYLDGERPMLDLPLDLQATAFQWKVWNELRRIPAGTTRTYRQVADAIGHPGAVRAVGTACGSNPVSLVIPCHRVVRTDGGLGGYRWGLQRKQFLLAHERRLAEAAD
ncbi:MAG: bifunctional DNA-binding transcriptional regulator/O6-methylguanine-DNA methyltransferase Ada [Herpetosiphon sp.]